MICGWRGLGLALLLLAGCRAPDPSEAALRDTLAALQQAGEARSVSAVLEHVDPEFAGIGGAADRDELRRYLAALFLTQQRIGVTRLDSKLTLRGPHADVEIRLLVTGSGGLLPERGRVLTVVSQWRFVDGRWRVINARWS